MKKTIKQIRRILAGVLALTMLVSPLSIFAETQEPSTEAPAEEVYHTEYYDDGAQTDLLKGWPVAPPIEGQAAVVIDLQYGAILYSKNADTVLYPASITKILTCLLAVENLDMSRSFAMTQSAAFGIESGSSSIYADTDEVFTVEQAVMALMLESANEMALMLGELVSGSEKKFIEKMNERARKLGCTNTHFNNPNGLPDENHYTTAGDMAKIARACWMNPMFQKFATTSSYEIPPTNKQPETRYMSNHHRMMPGKEYAYEGVMGGKTGYTIAAGNTLVTYAKRGSMRLAVVVLNSIGGAYADTAALLDYSFGNFHKLNVRSVQQDSGVLLPQLRFHTDDADGESLSYRKGNPFVIVPEGVTREQIDVIRIPHINYAGLPYNEYVYYYQGNRIGTSHEYLRRIVFEN